MDGVHRPHRRRSGSSRRRHQGQLCQQLDAQPNQIGTLTAITTVRAAVTMDQLGILTNAQIERGMAQIVDDRCPQYSDTLAYAFKTYRVYS